MKTRWAVAGAGRSLLALGLMAPLMTACGPSSVPASVPASMPAALQTVAPDALASGQAIACAGLDGLVLADAERLAASRGLTVRVVSVEGVESPVTLDYLPTRVNLDTESGIVSGCSAG